MWDLSLDATHTFAVGVVQVVVHNDSCTTTSISRFGRSPNTPDPRGPGVNDVRPGVDIAVDANGMVSAQSGAIGSQGASAFTDPTTSGLTGHYYTLPEGTSLPDGVGIVRDGVDMPGGTEVSGHTTIYPTRDMPEEEFNQLVQNLPWQYGGRLR